MLIAEAFCRYDAPNIPARERDNQTRNAFATYWCFPRGFRSKLVRPLHSRELPIPIRILLPHTGGRLVNSRRAQSRHALSLRPAGLARSPERTPAAGSALPHADSRVFAQR